MKKNKSKNVQEKMDLPGIYPQCFYPPGFYPAPYDLYTFFPVIVKRDASTQTELPIKSNITKRKKITTGRVKRFVEKRGGKLISGEYSGKNLDKTFIVECDKKLHTWKTNASNILYRNQWCLKCSQEVK